MRKLVFAFGALAGFFCAVKPLSGCGDKLVLLGRGIRFQRMIATKHPATILVYLSPGSGISAADREYQLRPLLKLAGHKPQSVSNSSDLTKEISSGRYDLILADYSEASALQKQINAAKPKPTLIPVMYNPNADQRAVADKEYSCLVAPSKKNYDLLKVIDQAMTTRSEVSGPTCQKPRV